MATTALVLSILGVVLAIYQLLGAAIRRPRLCITASEWHPTGAGAVTFATVRVSNKPIGRVLPLLTRDVAQACTVSIDFLVFHTNQKVLPTIPGRWSSNPTPLRSVEVDSTEPDFTLIWSTGPPQFDFDPNVAPPHRDLGITTPDKGVEVAVAVLTDVGAYAWGTESYLYNLRKPEWELQHDTYRVEVTANALNATEVTVPFKLEYLDEDFATFRLLSLGR